LRGDRWSQALVRAPDAAARLEGAVQTRRQYGVQDFTARARRFSGEGWVLAGDAAIFLDPVFSSGVFLGLESAERCVRHHLAGTLDRYEAEMREAAATFEKVVLAFYDGSFLDVVLAPRALQSERYRQAIVSLLAGDVFGGGPAEARFVTERFDAMAELLRRRMERG
jgi:flavin-dependent dehydrogenase